MEHMGESSCDYPRVLKEHLNQFINQPVTIIGKYKGKIGQKLSLEISENSTILVENCDLKLDGNPKFLEVRGIVKSLNSVNMVELQEVAEDEKEPFG